MDYPLQKIRRFYEAAVENALCALDGGPITAYTDNAYYSDKSSEDEFALIRLSFGDMHELTIGGMMEHITGTLIVDIFAAKGRGPGRVQNAAEAVLIGLAGINSLLYQGDAEVIARTGPISGPQFTASLITPNAIQRRQSAPHFQARLSCSIRAGYRAPV